MALIQYKKVDLPLPEPDNAENFAFLDIQANAFQNFKIAKGFMDILDTNHIAIFLSTYRPYDDKGYEIIK